MPIIIPSPCKIYDFHHSSMWLNNGIMYGKYKHDLVIDIEIAQEMVRDRIKVSAGISRPFLIDVTDLLCVDTDGRNYLAGPDGCELISAGAIYTTNKLLAFVGNAFILLDKPLVPAKVFSNELAALRWLEPFKYPN
jgi:hypothetical protein